MAIHMSRIDELALITLDRPEALNALSFAQLHDLSRQLDSIAESDTRALLVTGAGDRAFSAGADIHEFSQSVGLGAARAVRDFVRRGQAMTARLEAFRKPVIAAVNGLAFGGGKQRQRNIPQRLNRPQRFAAGQPHRGPKRIGFGQPHQRSDLGAAPPPNILDRRKWLVRPAHAEGRSLRIGKPPHHPKPQPHGETPVSFG